MAPVAMWVAWVVVFALAEPAGPPQATDDATINSDDPTVTPITPATPAAPSPPADAVAPSPPAEAATPPPPAAAVEEPQPAHRASAPSVRPNAGLGLEIGYAHGGDRLATLVALTPGHSQSIHVGDGVFFALAGNWMPLWTESGVGLGLYARAGAKFAGAGDGGTTTLSFVRVPLAAGAQLLLPLGARWFVLGRLGVMTEVFGQLTTKSGGVSDTFTDFSPRLGGFLDAGLYWAATERTGFCAIARYERIDVSYGGDVMNANNLGALVAASLRF